MINRPEEELLSEEQAGFRPKRSRTNLHIRMLIEKHIDHYQDLYHNFIDYKKTHDHVWHKGLWRVLRRYNIDEELVTLQDLTRFATQAKCQDGKWARNRESISVRLRVTRPPEICVQLVFKHIHAASGYTIRR